MSSTLPALAKYIVKLAVPALFCAVLLPEKLEAEERVTVAVPVNRFPSSPLNVAVIVNAKFTEGLWVLDTSVIAYTKLLIGSAAEVPEVIPGEAAAIVRLPADSILRFVKVIVPAAVFPVVVPEKVPVGVRLRVIAYIP